MNQTIKDLFLENWVTYFPGAELPIVLSYADETVPLRASRPESDSHCLICHLAPVRQGATRYFDADTTRCGGARNYLGFETERSSTFPHFLSCGIPGEIEGERYKRSPELAVQYMESQPTFKAPGRAAVFKRWDNLAEQDSPEVVIFFATADVLSGLFTLANFDEVDPQGVIAPFGSGCSSIVYHPYLELQSKHPRAVIGMFDISARPCVASDVLSFAVPWPKFVSMVEQMEESFLITSSWHQVRSRL